jgi:hypothetical protein
MNTISVSGTGEVAGRPDTLIVDIGVSVLRPTVNEATTEAAKLADTVIAALTSGGVADRDIQTTSYSIYPEYDYSGQTQRLTGYRVSNVVTAKVRDVESAGGVIDAAVRAGGDATVVNGIRFDIEESSELVTAAREAAWNDAKAKAEQLAGLAGVTLGRAVSISETFSPAPPPIAFEEFLAAADQAATPIQPGEQAVTVTVTVEFSIG